MGYIYGQASRVVMWLGTESHDTSLAISTLESIGRGVEITRINSVGFKTNTRPGSFADYLQGNEQAVRAKVNDWIAIRKLFRAPWFARLWTFQEIAQAKDTAFVVGGQTIGLGIFRAALGWLRTRFEAPGAPSAIGSIIDLNLFRIVTRPVLEGTMVEKGSMLRLCNMTNQLHCEDPRDRIYAILSLMPADQAACIKPDYDKEVEDVYTEAVLADFDLAKTLGMLRICDFGGADSNLDLPTWVADLSVPRRRPLQSFTSASISSEAEVCYFESQRTLQIRGKLTGIITKVAVPIPLSAGISEILATCYAWEPHGAGERVGIANRSIANAFITMLFVGTAKAGKLTRRPQMFSLESLREAYKSLIVDGLIPRSMRAYTERLEFCLPGRTFFITDKGYMGLYSASTRPGDKVFIALRCSNPLVPRPVGRRHNHYQVGGECFVHGLMNGEGLLGSLPAGWPSCWSDVRGRFRHIFVSPDGRLTQLDPRAGPLPSG